MSNKSLIINNNNNHNNNNNKELDIRNNLKLRRPNKNEKEETTKKTQLALQKLIENRINQATTLHIPASSTTNADNAEYYSYNVDPNAPGYNQNVKKRVIKIYEKQIDPLDPPKHKHQRSFARPKSPPAPILHSPTRNLTREEKKAWDIPPAISNTVNPRGYLIPLHMREAADGRNLQEHTLSKNFAPFIEALNVAEQTSREEIKLRAEKMRQNSLKEKEKKIQKLREMVQNTRDGNFDKINTNNDFNNDNLQDNGWGIHNNNNNNNNNNEKEKLLNEKNTKSSKKKLTDEDIAKEQRDRLRKDRKRERERELRKENMGNAAKKAKRNREESRDISEKIALGTANIGQRKGEALFDSRLFNQESGMNSGFTADDSYNLYSEPLFNKDSSNKIYRPKALDDGFDENVANDEYDKLINNKKFQPSRGFRGSENNTSNNDDKIQNRNQPVQFEKAKKTHNNNNNNNNNNKSDPFGIDDFIKEAKSKQK